MAKDPLIGTALGGRYLVQELLGSGGMGNVYLALQVALERKIAVKVLNPYYATRANAAERFDREARAASRLEHPNIVRVYDFGESEGGLLYIAMELFRGEALDARLRRTGPLPLTEAAELLQQVCGALACAHDQGVIHRDLKPANIMLVQQSDDVRVKVLDFGIAKIIEEGASAEESVTRDVVGTPEYMAPEQILGDPVGPQTDLYAVGVNLYELLTGQRPFSGKSSVQTYLAHLNEACPALPDPLPARGERAAEAAGLVARLLDKERGRRPASAAAVQRALVELTQGRPVDWGRLEAAAWSGPVSPVGGAHASGASLKTETEPALEAPDAPTLAAPPPAAPLSSTQQERREVIVVHALATFDEPDGPPLDLEDQLVALQALQRAWQSVLADHGGEAVRPGSGPTGAVTAVFGAPVAREHDLLAAVRCALALRSTRAQGPGEAYSLPIRCGVASGPALVAESALGVEVIGDVPVRAALLAGEAPLHGVALSDAVVRDAHSRLRVTPLARSGGNASSRAWLLHGLQRPEERRRSGVEGVSARLVGRRRERAELRQLSLQVANERSPRLIVVSGEAGLGKTRLVQEHVAWLRGAMPAAEVFHGRAEALRASAPLALLKSVIWEATGLVEGAGFEEVAATLSRALAPSVGDGAAPAARLLAVALGCGGEVERQQYTADTEPKALKDRGVDSLVALLVTQAHARPVFLVLDDVHWADRATLEWIEAALPRLADLPVCVIATCRPELFDFAPRWRCDGEMRTHIELLPLGRADSERLVRSLLQRVSSPPPALVDFLVERADGNPFYAEELLKTLVVQGILCIGQEAWQVHLDGSLDAVVPRGVRALLLARVDSLPPDARHALRAAAVVGRTFWRGAVAALFGGLEADRLLEAMTLLEERGFVHRRHAPSLEGEVEYRFDHALLRDVAYDSLLRRVRRDCHRVAADWFEARLQERDARTLALVARHAELAEDAARAFACYSRAGELAAYVYANADAADLLARALEVGAAGVQARDVARVASRLGETLEVMSKFAEARQAYERALALLEPSAPAETRAEYARLRARAGYRDGRLAEALEELDALQVEVDELQAPVRLAVAADRGWLYARQGREEDARRQLEAALARAPGPAGPIVRGQDQTQLDGDALQCAWERARANALNTLGTVCLGLGRWSEAAEHYEAAQQGYRTLGLRHAEAACRLNQGIVLVATQRLDAAAAALIEAAAAMREVGYEHGVANARCYLAHVRRLQGRIAEGEELASATYQWAAGAAMSVLCAEAAIELALLHAARREWDDAWRWAELAVEHAAAAGASDTLTSALGARGRIALSLHRRRGHSQMLERAREDLQRAVEACGRGYRRDERARLQWALSEAWELTPGARPSEVRTLRSASLRALRAMGLTGEADRLERGGRPLVSIDGLSGA